MSSVDVIVPCYNYGRYLRQCVESALSQEGVDVRVLIIDDASPDGSGDVAEELAQTDPRIHFIRHSVNRGHIATYNEGIEWVSGDYYLLLSADDFVLPGALLRAVSAFNAHPEAGLVYGDVLEVLGDSCDCEYRPEQTFSWQVLSGREFIQLSGARNIVPTPTAVVRASLQKQLGGYVPELPHAGDMEMWLRIAAHAPVVRLTSQQAVYRRHATNMSSGYLSKSWLPDLEQRRRAIEYFVRTCRHQLAFPDQVREELLMLLAIDAIHYAGSVFNEGDLPHCQKLAEFAAAVHPPIRQSRHWYRLAAKRSLGITAWRAVRPMLRKGRSFVQSLANGDIGTDATRI